MAQDGILQSQWNYIYNEEDVPKYDLPDPLLCNDGTKVTTKEEWESKRRAEILNMFRTYVYGKAPELDHALRYTLDSIDTGYMKGQITKKKITIYLGKSSSSPSFHVILCVPNKVKGKIVDRVPVFFQISYTLDLDNTVIQRLAHNGMGYALFSVFEVTPDNPSEAFSKGIIPYFYRKSQLYPDPDQWGAISAWSWAASRTMDYLQNDKNVDAEKIAIIGQSRLGKTALWAGAQDERFAIVVPVNSGCVGTALSKRCYGETVWSINKSFPHWFAGNFKQFDMRESLMPFDQHEVIALCAPRPVYICSSEKDIWSDPKGQFLAGKAAEEVYALYGKDGLKNFDMPAINQPMQDGYIGFHIRAGQHAILGYDWEQAIKFAKRFFM